MWVRIPLETYIFILNFSLPPRSEQVNGAVANEIKHVHSPEVIVVLDPRYDLSYNALYISTCSIALRRCHMAQLISLYYVQKSYSNNDLHCHTMRLILHDSVYTPGIQKCNTHSWPACEQRKRFCLCHICTAIICILFNLLKQRQRRAPSRHPLSLYRSLKYTFQNSMHASHTHKTISTPVFKN